MKVFSAIILSFLISIISLGNAITGVDYQINRAYYEAHCVNKNKPKSHCHGKCKMKKDAEKNSQQTELVKVGFELNILPQEPISIPKAKILQETDSKVSYSLSQQHILKGFSEISPMPPRCVA